MYGKLILLSKNKKKMYNKKKVVYQENNMNELSSFKKGQIFIVHRSKENYNFYQFDGENWVEIK